MKEITAFMVGTAVFPTIQEAQKAEILGVIKGSETPVDIEVIIADMIVKNSDEVVSILTCQPKSAPRKPRKDIGTKRPPKDKATLPV